ncbi:MAG: hypothetical protein RLZZ05_1671, partial [Bacteroidota bacterium]
MSKFSDRRKFLKTTSAATIAALGATMPLSGLLSSMKPFGKQSSADTVILLWMGGGMAHTETFDPKRFTAYSKGIKSNDVLSTFQSVPTVLDGVHFSEGLESVGNIMDRGTVIRSYVAADMGHILHSRHQ